MKQPGVDHLILETEKKTDITGEKIMSYIEELRGFLHDWEIMPDSFLLREDYENQAVLAGLGTQEVIAFLKQQRLANPERESKLKKARKNKLITAWFGVLSWMRLIVRKTQLNVPELDLSGLERQFAEIKERELSAVDDYIATRRIVLPEENGEASSLLKKIKKEVAPQFLDQKIELVKRVEKSIELLIARLEELLCQKSN